MAKVNIIIEDVEDGGIDISLVTDPPLTEETQELTDAHKMAYFIMQMIDHVGSKDEEDGSDD